MSMLIMSFFSWWYGRGWKTVLGSLGPRLKNTASSFSAGQLLRTLFAPWRRIITSPGAGLDAKLKAIGDNLVSRAVGFVVRLGVLFTAFVCLVVIAVLTIAEMIIWPLLPVAVPGLLIAAVLLK